MTSSLHPLTRKAVPLLTRSIIIVALVIAMPAVTGCRKPNDAQTKAAQPTVTSHPPDASKHAGTHDHQPSATPSAAKPVNPDQYRTDGTRRMAKRLAELSRTADIEANQYLNVRRVAAIREELKKPGINRPVALATLAPELLKAGQIPEAIEVFEELQREIDSGKFKVTNRNMYAAFRELSAFTWLRLAEIENCVNHHSSDSCLVPIGGNGFHTLQRGSRKAIELFLKELEEDDTRYRIRWYLNLAYMTLNEYPDGVPEKWRLDPSIFESDMAFPRFHDRAMELGVAVQGLSGGSVTEDFDCDGDIDIMASSWGIDDQIRYFQNQGDGTFAERTVEAGLVGIVGGLNLVHGDYDNDGFADVLVLRGAWLGAAGHHPNSLLRNRGDGTFDDVTKASGLLTNRPTQTAAWADFDRDGWLDLFIGNETWKNDTQPCELFRNNGDGTFTECAQAAGVDRIGIVKGVAAGDYDNDGYPDLYLSCMGSPNSLLHNLGAKSNNESNVPLAFEDVTAKAGVADPNYSFPTWFFDYDNDGWLDLFVASYAATLDHVVASWMGIANDGKLPMLYHNNGDGTFTNVAADVGLDCITVPMGTTMAISTTTDGWISIWERVNPISASSFPMSCCETARGNAFLT